MDCFTPISYRCGCMYVCMYVQTHRQTECDQGPRQLRLCGALYLTRLCLGVGSFSAVPVQSDPLSRRRRRHQGHCLRRSSDLVGLREGDIWAGTGEREGGTRGRGVRGDDRLMANGGLQCSYATRCSRENERFQGLVEGVSTAGASRVTGGSHLHNLLPGDVFAL